MDRRGGDGGGLEGLFVDECDATASSSEVGLVQVGVTGGRGLVEWKEVEMVVPGFS